MLDSSPTFRFIELDEVASTNSFLADYRPLEPTEMTLVTAEYQTAGRGQAGNSCCSAKLLHWPSATPSPASWEIQRTDMLHCRFPT